MRSRKQPLQRLKEFYDEVQSKRKNKNMNLQATMNFTSSELKI